MKLLQDNNVGVESFNKEMEVNKVMNDNQFFRFQDVREDYDKFSELYNSGEFSYKTLTKMFGKKDSLEISKILSGEIEYNLDELINFTELSNIKSSTKYEILSKLHKLKEEKWKKI